MRPKLSAADGEIALISGLASWAAAAHLSVSRAMGMRRLSRIEVCGLVLGIVFLVFGIIAIIWPQTGLVFHPANDAIGMPAPSEPETVTTKSSRVYGVLAILLGSGMIGGALYHEKE